jgi:surfeit locus 1 family protein
MRFRKPELIPLLFIIAAEILLIGLGAWQIERLEWKNGLIVAIEKAQAEPVLTVLPKELSGLEYRKVELTGKLITDKTLHRVGARQGEHPGFFLLTPFILKDGRIILVNRGFSPADQTAEIKTPSTVKGVLRPARGKRAFFIPDNQPEKNVWLYEDIAAMSASTKLELLPLIVEATGNYEKNVYPIPNDGTIALRNDHLGYAITWFSLAVVGLVLFGIYYREHLSPPLA